MIPALTTAGIGRPASAEEFIKMAARHGFGGVDTDPLALIEEHGLDGARALLKEHNIVIGSFGLPVEWRKDEETFRDSLVKLAAAANAAAQLGVTACTTWMMPSQAEPAAQWTATAIRRLRRCAELLGCYGAQLGIEPVAPHHLRTIAPHPFVWDFPGGIRIAEGIDKPNVGLLVDSFHWYCSGAKVEDLEAIPPEMFVHVHINDAPAGIPVEQQLDNGRIFAGEGVIDLKTFLAVVRKKGYRGCVSQEVLARDGFPGTPDELAARSARSMLPLFA